MDGWMDGWMSVCMGVRMYICLWSAQAKEDI